MSQNGEKSERLAATPVPVAAAGGSSAEVGSDIPKYLLDKAFADFKAGTIDTDKLQSIVSAIQAMSVTSAPARVRDEPPREPRVRAERPKPFRGQMGDGNRFDAWEFTVENYLRLARIPTDSSTARDELRCLLQDGAALWLRSYDVRVPAEHQTYKELMRCLRTHYAPVNEDARARDALDKCVQRMSVQSYVDEFKACLLRVSDLSDRDVLHRFVRGLKPRVRELMAINEPDSFDAACASAVRIDTVTYSLRTQEAKGGPPKDGRFETPAARRTPQTPAAPPRPHAPTQQVDLSAAGSVECFSCKEVGHYQSDCPKLTEEEREAMREKWRHRQQKGGRGGSRSKGRGKGSG
jgi:hypothetical protein